MRRRFFLTLPIPATVSGVAWVTAVFMTPPLVERRAEKHVYRKLGRCSLVLILDLLENRVKI